MASICNRCALRLRKVTQTEAQQLSKRTFSSCTPRLRGPLPRFKESSNGELNNALSKLREKYFIPAYMHEQERKLVLKSKYRQQLQDNPQTAIVGGEEITLQPIDRRNDIPPRRELVSRALNLIIKGDSKDWHNLPKLLRGLHQGVKKPASEALMEKIVRKGLEAKQIGVIIQCLMQAEHTGMTLKYEPVTRTFLAGLHELAQESRWNHDAVVKALRDANVVSKLLETKHHGTGKLLVRNDPRTRPEVLGLFLELAAVYAYKHGRQKDTEGLVRAYAGRLIKNLEKSQYKPMDLQLLQRGKQWPMLQAITIWHGLSLAEKVLGKTIPQPEAASSAIAEYEVSLRRLAFELEALSPEKGTYNEQALTAWRQCIRD